MTNPGNSLRIEIQCIIAKKLIKRKGLIGKVVGFAPMVGLFVGYLIIPLVVIGLTSMSSSFASMSSTKY